MSPTLFALVGFATWTALLVFGVAGLRALNSRSTGKELNTFAADGSDVEGLLKRWTRVHLNCLEFLPVASAVGLVAVVSGQAAITDPLAMPLLGLRIAQSVVHLASTAMPFVLIRAALFVGQVLIVLSWAFRLLTA